MRNLWNQPGVSIFCLAGVILAGGYAATACVTTPEPVKTALMAKLKKTDIHSFELPAPKEQKHVRYLGIPDRESFFLNQIETDVLLIEIFSMYCPICQKEAPSMNRLFKAIERETYLRGRIKIIGIGATNSPFEVNLFKEKYDVPFPLFADKDFSVSGKLGAELTPTFIGIRFFEDGTHVVFHFESGSIGEVADFLGMLIQKSQLRGEIK